MWKTLGRWWNERWGQRRRVVRLRSNGKVWRVEAGQGNGDAQYWIRDYPTEAAAWDMVNLLLKRSGDEWKDLGGGD